MDVGYGPTLAADCNQASHNRVYAEQAFLKTVKFSMNWIWPRRSALLYCVKVAMATFLGYILAFGGTESAVYSAMSAALIMGASRGEDIMTSTNRVRGTLAGMLVGTALTFLPLPPALAVAVGVGATAFVCLAFGWGVPAARVGTALCAVMVLVHVQDAVHYSVVRAANTLIGIAAGLVVSYFVLPIRGREAVMQAAEASLAAAGDMLDKLASAAQPLPAGLHVAMLDRVLELEKALRDSRKEFDHDSASLTHTVRQVGLICAGTLTAAIAHSDLCKAPAAIEAGGPLLASAARLAVRARKAMPLPEAELEALSTGIFQQAGVTDMDATTLQGMALGLRKVAIGLDAMGR